ncbi:hypothetical protein QTL97_17090 [Sporosarcina thermotolerans]|uniref:Uncharacterized protein n=1 Tax=Sporosarcina thermotolerans TaxID=633404 RepID=A0AAW9ADH1_9BACL|nr:hypothetical protein [Sporosarcina thermotolerans]MDW0118643.1 hypothetical protein [Sporosarcina thermotolerans]WHT49565.1 hypothetical protein QNH10_08680 [Sporosarcina thermotolerans]
MRDCEINVDQAVENNIAWCKLICEAYGKRSDTTEKVWALTSEAPTYYPELITMNRKTKDTDILEFLNLNHISSVKDSYATLQLASYGYQMLFEAEWICYPTLNEYKPDQYEWNIVRTEKEFEHWKNLTGLEIPSRLLEIDGVNFFFIDCPSKFAAFIVNKAANVIGISNVFSSDMDITGLWRSIPQAVSKEFPGVPLVGYEQGESLSAAHASGWTSIGPLRVWIKFR